MRYYVFYNDDFADNGGVGYEAFDDKEEAESFIEERISRAPAERRLVSNYTVVRGVEVKVTAVRFADRVEIG